MVPIEPHAVVLEDHAVAVSNGAIVAILPTVDARARFCAEADRVAPGGCIDAGFGQCAYA